MPIPTLKQPSEESSGYLVEEKYSSRANPRRGYHDSDVLVTFWNKSEDFQKRVMTMLYDQALPMAMWRSQPAKVSGDAYNAVWKFNHGYDSGD